ncbi:hypothetical protein KDAU_23510 [Dictyobacter aurantiacus]|uniref:Uncharacterized protein n=1 Tax=Dictyobacter aurantiacus TaxID=1936993 RepID=A0A401ZDT7_9CHLR|nr:hypothetical protein KDAU_23510 [Dictyobacter aurantiacus]
MAGHGAAARKGRTYGHPPPGARGRCAASARKGTYSNKFTEGVVIAPKKEENLS